MSSPILNSLVIKARHVSSISPKKSSLLFRHGFESSNSAGYQASIESEYLSGDNNKTRLAFKTYGGGNTTNTDDVKMTISETGVVNIYGSLDMNGGKISNLGTPVNAGDATTKSYVDGSVSGLVSSQWTTSGSNIFYTTGNVGIGTNNPSGSLLYVNSLTNTSLARFQGSHSALLFKTSATTSGYTGTLEINDVGLYLGHDSTSRAIIFNQQTNERLRIHTNGNVGIGTNNPLQLLHVNGTARIQKVVNLDAPVDAGDATNKGYVDGAIGTLTTNVGKLDTSMGLVESEIGTLTTNVGKLDTSMGLVVFQENGVLLSDLSANGFKIKSLADPIDNQDAATKKYVDDNIGGGNSFLSTTGGTMTGNLTINGAALNILGNSSIQFSGGSITTGIDMSSRSIDNLALGANPTSAANQQYVADTVSASIAASITPSALYNPTFTGFGVDTSLSRAWFARNGKVVSANYYFLINAASGAVYEWTFPSSLLPAIKVTDYPLGSLTLTISGTTINGLAVYTTDGGGRIRALGQFGGSAALVPLSNSNAPINSELSVNISYIIE